MTQRKPPNVSFTSWVERQIRTAEAQGGFADLPGTGKPIPNVDRPQPELAWVANYLRRENVDAAMLLPPSLALAKEVEQLPERLRAERSETRVRAIVDDLNARIRRAYQYPQSGPPMRVRTVRVEDAVEQWRNSIVPTVVAAAAPAPSSAPRRWNWLYRRTR